MADEKSTPKDDDLEAMLDAQLAEALAQELADYEEDEFSDVDSPDAQLSQTLAELGLDSSNSADVDDINGVSDINDVNDINGVNDINDIDGSVTDEPSAMPSDESELEMTLAGLETGGDFTNQPIMIDEEEFLTIQIKEALALEAQADESAPDAAQGIEDFVKNIDIYEDEYTDYDQPETPKRSAIVAKIDSLSPKFLLATSTVLTMVVLLATILTVNWAISSSRINAEYNRMGNIIRLGDAVSNNAGFIFTNIPISFIDKEIILTKINMSRISTVFHFDGFIDLDIYDASITDDWGRTYYIDYSYYERDNHDDGDHAETRLWFDSLSQGFKSFDLVITERDTQLSSRTRFSAGQNFTLEPTDHDR